MKVVVRMLGRCQEVGDDSFPGPVPQTRLPLWRGFIELHDRTLVEAALSELGSHNPGPEARCSFSRH